ncbi:hypothetical protein NPIL_287231 [Nephila pilipes]|uniref:Uncharacterized protein n=1 Tax=Nephila pilipes TaxID=299642 RepID=A0A8X6PMN7_NEPPI|nr:hypothetical protein NPIL_287231 [Nephila pilipes]
MERNGTGWMRVSDEFQEMAKVQRTFESFDEGTLTGSSEAGLLCSVLNRLARGGLDKGDVEESEVVIVPFVWYII